MAHKPTILLVDDSPLVHQVYGPQLEDAGFEVRHAEDGIAAINTTFLEMPDVIVLDIYMPKINGYQVCRLLKDHAETRAIPIVLITSGEAHRLVDHPKHWSFATGADAYVKKGEMDLVATVQPLLGRPRGPHVATAARRAMSEIEIMTALSALLDKQLYRDVSHLQELNEKKSAFVSLVAHELKAPLAVIKGSMGNLASKKFGTLSPTQRDSVAVVQRTVDRLARLIRELLDLSRIEAGRMVLHREPVALGALLDDIITTYQGEAAAKQVVVEWQRPTDDITVTGDRDRLEQVFINLLINAIKYTPDGGLVTIALQPQASLVRVEMRDTGAGIGTADLDRIFHLFERLDPEDGQGVGLGLPIARTLVELHGGRVWAESDGTHGSTFIVELPLT